MKTRNERIEMLEEDIKALRKEFFDADIPHGKLEVFNRLLSAYSLLLYMPSGAIMADGGE